MLPLIVASCAGQASFNEAPAPPPPAEAAPINGTVIDADGKPMPGLIVAIGGERTTSDGGGRFSFAKIPAGYDLVIASPDHTGATVYQELTRRDPVVAHDGGGRRGHAQRARAHRAEIDVTVTGGAAGKDSWHVHFSSPRADADLLLRELAPDAAGVAKPGTLVIEWDGADTISGVVMALLMKDQQTTLSPWFAQQPVTLRAGETARVQLALAKVPVVMRPAGKVTQPPGVPRFRPELHEFFAVPGAGRALHSSFASRRESYAVPDLRAFGIELCTEAFQWNPYFRSHVTRCGGDVAQAAAIALPPAPSFSSPAWATTAALGMRFSWTQLPNAVYQLTLATATGNPGAELPGSTSSPRARRRAGPICRARASRSRGSSPLTVRRSRRAGRLRRSTSSRRPVTRRPRASANAGRASRRT